MSTPETPQDRIRQLFDDDPLTDIEAEEANGAPPDDSVIASALAAAGHDVLSREASELLLALTLDSAGVEPQMRTRLVEAAQRGLAKRRDDASPLPRLLFLARRGKGEALEAVAEAVSVTPDVLLDVERGVTSLEQFGPEPTAAWIAHFDVPLERARAAIVQTLQLQKVDDRAAASRVDAVDVDEAPFLLEVMDLLEGFRR